MKTLLFLLFVAIPFLGGVFCKNQCDDKQVEIPKEWLTMKDDCRNKMAEQVQVEFNAAMTYMAMGEHFSRDNVNRPGFAKFFFESASEEREHGIKIISYLLMRANPQDFLKTLINEPKPLYDEWSDGVSALKNALKLEASVTENIRGIIKVCEHSKAYICRNSDCEGSDCQNIKCSCSLCKGHNCHGSDCQSLNCSGDDCVVSDFNDYQLVDYLSGDFLKEQYESQRELAGMISTLGKMTDSRGDLGEYLFDKKLLNNELF